MSTKLSRMMGAGLFLSAIGLLILLVSFILTFIARIISSNQRIPYTQVAQMLFIKNMFVSFNLIPFWLCLCAIGIYLGFVLKTSPRVIEYITNNDLPETQVSALYNAGYSLLTFGMLIGVSLCVYRVIIIWRG